MNFNLVIQLACNRNWQIRRLPGFDRHSDLLQRKPSSLDDDSEYLNKYAQVVEKVKVNALTPRR